MESGTQCKCNERSVKDNICSLSFVVTEKETWDRDGKVESRADAFILFICRGAPPLTKMDVCEETILSLIEAPSPLFFSLSAELIDSVSSIHLSLCCLATGALSGVEGGSSTVGAGWVVKGWVRRGGCLFGCSVGFIKQKPIGRFIQTDPCFLPLEGRGGKPDDVGHFWAIRNFEWHTLQI